MGQDPYADMERKQEERDLTWAKWRGRGTFVHDPTLPPNTWAVNGVEQQQELTEDALWGILLQEGTESKRVSVSAPLHLVLGRIIGRQPAYA